MTATAPPSLAAPEARVCQTRPKSSNLHAMKLEERFPFFTKVSDSARQMLTSTLISHDVGPSTRLIDRDDEVSGVYLVERGSLRVYYLTPEGREGTLYWVDPGDSCILAINCVFAKIRYPAWVESEREPTRFSVIPANVYRDLFEREPAIRAFSFEVLSARTFELMTLLTEAQSLGLERRVASFLLRRSGASNEVPMSQETIANHVGTAREVVSRILRSLAADGLVETRRGSIRLLDKTGLKTLL